MNKRRAVRRFGEKTYSIDVSFIGQLYWSKRNLELSKGKEGGTFLGRKGSWGGEFRFPRPAKKK